MDRPSEFFPARAMSSQITTHPADDTEAANEFEMDETNVPINSIDLPSVEDIIAACEIRLRKYLKRRNLERRLAAAQGYEPFCPSNSIRGNGSTENIFIDYYVDPNDYSARSVRKEKVTDGSWLFLSFMSGGWSYDIVKRFIMKEYQVKYLRNKNLSERLPMDGEYKAVVKFKNSEELNQVVMSLQNKNIHHKFLYFSFDKIPITYYDSDSDY